MAFDAKVYNILIASPGDVEKERNAIAEIIHGWNVHNAIKTKVVLLPVRWEERIAPEMGNTPQEIIDKRILPDCDLLIGVFWKRIGTPTGKAISGSVREIEQFIDSNRPVMLYRSMKKVTPGSTDNSQHRKLATFFKKIRQKQEGITWEYSNLAEFRRTLASQLHIRIDSFLADKKKAQVSSEDSLQRQIAETAQLHRRMEQIENDFKEAGQTLAVDGAATFGANQTVAGQSITHTQTLEDGGDSGTIITSGAEGWDVNQGAIATIVLAGTNETLPVINAVDGAVYILTIVQGSGGGFTIDTWTVNGNAINWVGTPSRAAPTLSTAEGARDKVSISTWTDGTYVYGDATFAGGDT